MESVIQTSQPTRLTQASSGVVAGGSGSLAGIFVASATTATITVYDGSSASGKILVNTFTPVAATWYPLPFMFNAGLFVALTGTIDCTVGTGSVSS